MENKKHIKIFTSFEQENQDEYKRRARLSLDERLQEFSVIQERAWGKEWTHKPIQKTARFETLDC